MKIVCSACKEQKKKGELVNNRKYCKRCNARWTAEWRAQHPDKAKAVSSRYYAAHREDQKKRVQRLSVAKRERFRRWKAQQRCQRCPENHPACLEFHRRDPSKKDMNVSQLWRLGYAWERLMQEVAKCDILCANCHKKLHFALRLPVKTARIERVFSNPQSYRKPKL